MSIIDKAVSHLGSLLVKHLSRPLGYYRSFSICDVATLEKVLQPADVLLVEGNQRISTAIKYMTQSTWSHAAIYIGDALAEKQDAGKAMLIEADLKSGVIAVPVSKYESFNIRICRPVNLTRSDRDEVIAFVISRLGYQYDLKNITDLARYLISTPPVPQAWRRRMLALGSGDPTRAICSTLIAQAFQEVRYPILPHVLPANADGNRDFSAKEIMHIRHHSLYAPRDFDLSPYFQVIKPTLESGFNYKEIVWDNTTKVLVGISELAG